MDMADECRHYKPSVGFVIFKAKLWLIGMQKEAARVAGYCTSSYALASNSSIKRK